MPATQFAGLLESMRPHQWSKNLLLGVPALMAQVWMLPRVDELLLGAFIAFSLAASGNYIVNDLIDIESDRQHPQKSLRAIAAGRLSTRNAWIAGPLLIGSGLLVGAFGVGTPFAWLLVAYLATSIAYTLVLKRLLVADVIVLAALYALRLLAGGAAIDIEVSSWLIAFSLFLFVSLAFAKRLIELDAAVTSGKGSNRSRAYGVRDRQAIATAGPASGMLAVLVLALYVSSEPIRERYTQPDLLWLLCPLMLYWILRVWFIALRSELHHDPVVFALRDLASYAVLAAVLGVLILAAGG